ncbi:MAG: hypothetical protein ACOC7U_06830 [Spirochaetota bacterium]
MREKKQQLRDFVKQAGQKPLTLLYGAKNTEFNNAVTLAECLRKMEIQEN